MQAEEKAMAPHSSTLAWKIPWMEEPGRLQSMGSLVVGHDWVTSLTFQFHALEKEMATHSSVLAWKISGMEEPGGLPSMGSHRAGHNWSDLAAAAAAAACKENGEKEAENLSQQGGLIEKADSVTYSFETWGKLLNLLISKIEIIITTS